MCSVKNSAFLELPSVSTYSVLRSEAAFPCDRARVYMPNCLRRAEKYTRAGLPLKARAAASVAVYREAQAISPSKILRDGKNFRR